jgi:hypothetical protein
MKDFARRPARIWANAALLAMNVRAGSGSDRRRPNALLVP